MLKIQSKYTINFLNLGNNVLQMAYPLFLIKFIILKIILRQKNIYRLLITFAFHVIGYILHFI